MQTNSTATGDNDLATDDLGPLAWVLEELRKSLDGATKALRRFVRDAELARGSDLAEVDASQLRIARQQLHQAVGALEMVGLGSPAKVLRSMEALAQKFVQRPELCSDDAATKVERASFALTEYLEGVLKGKTASPVALFPQYREVMELAGGDRVHPADLWSQEWRWIDAAVNNAPPPLAYDASVRRLVDQAVLKVVRSSDAAAAQVMARIGLGLAAKAEQLEPRVFWKLSAAFFEALAHQLCTPDVYVKRTASRIIAQYITLARGETNVADRLAQDLLFYCAQSTPGAATVTPALTAVRKAYGLTRVKPVDYVTPQFGRFDPATLAQARKRVASAAETWAALAGGDTNRMKTASDQFAAVAESMVKLHPESGDLARALTRAVEATARTSEPPTAPLAMEVATAVLYLEAAYDDLDPTESRMEERSRRLAQRLENVTSGAPPEAMEVWMEELYRRVSDRQTMGSVVDELRSTLGQVEKSLDQFFRSPMDRVPLHEVPSQLSQMRGVFSVLGLDQASLAALRMRDSVEKFLVDQIDERSATGAGIFEKLGNSLGAMGFLIDMLSYQRALAKKIFIYDDDLGELRPVMGRDKAPQDEQMDAEAHAEAGASNVPAAEIAPEAAVVAAQTVPHGVPALAAGAPAAVDDEDAEMREIFLDEAREVVQTGLQAVAALRQTPADLGEQTTLRRAFHTLKGSSRMVGLTEIGEAAWALEQLANTWLAEQKPADDDLLDVCGEAMQQFGRWVEDIASAAATPWSAQPFRKSADALRLENQRVGLLAPQAPPALLADAEPVPAQVVEAVQESLAPAAAPAQAPVAPAAEPVPATIEFAPTQFPAETSDPLRPDFAATHTFAQDEPVAKPAPQPVSLDLGDFDFGDLAAVGEAPADAPQVPDNVGDFDEGVTLAPPPEPASNDSDDQTKVIGTLRIGIPLYNVYLNEADEWSRRLLTELSEWALEIDQSLRDSTVGLAHSLGGSSGTVGFHALADVARALEQAMQHVQLHRQGLPEHAQVFQRAAEDIRRLLHQFAAGFLKQPDPTVLPALQAILETEFLSDSGDAEIARLPESVAPGVLEPEISAPATLEPVTPVSRLSAEFEAGAAPLIVLPDETTDVVDALDADLFPIFEEEAADLFPQLGGALRQWAARPDNLGARNEALRVLHTLKGSARLSGAMRLGEMAHRLESAIESLGSESFHASQVEPMLGRFDTLQSQFDGLRKLAHSGAGAVEEPRAAPLDESAAPPEPTAAVAAPAIVERRNRGRAPGAAAPAQKAATQSLRVSAQLLDRLVNQAGEVIITRSRLDGRLGQMRTSLKELGGNLDRLRQQLREIEVQSESQLQTRMAQAKDSAQNFDPLEFDRFTRVQELTRIMAESVSDVATVQRSLQRSMEGTEDDLIAQARQARELQRDLLRTRMVE
ncbi:MAG: Hpt domain-containing protein, partial [Burkholderiaceae bacterium]